MDKIVVTVVGFFMAGFLYWFFLGRKEKSVRVENSVNITVSGGYTPEVIEVPIGQTTILNFTLKSKSHCLEEIVIPDFKLRNRLVVGTPRSVSITPQKLGEYIYSCGMNMYHGKIVVK